MLKIGNISGKIIGLCALTGIGIFNSSELFATEGVTHDANHDSASQVTSNTDKTREAPPPQNSNSKDAWDNFAPPPDKKFDWIQLTSGEWLKGELMVYYNYSLEFDSDEMDLQKFDWEDVKQIRTAGFQSLLIEPDDGKGRPVTVVGVLHLIDDKVKLTAGSETLEFDRSKIISIAKGSTKEADLWTGEISLGVNARSGNSDLVDSSFIANAKRRAAKSRFLMDYIGNYSKAESVETSNNHRLSSHIDIFKTTRFFWRPIYIEYHRDKFKNIKHQVTTHTAFGYDFIHTPKTEWEVSGGVGFLYKKFFSVEVGESLENTSPGLGFGTKYDTEVTNWLDYLFDFSLQIVNKDVGRYLHHLITTLESDLISDLDLDVSFVWDRNQDPQPAANGTVPKKDDFQLIVGVSYEF